MARRPVNPEMSQPDKNRTRSLSYHRHRKGKEIPACQLCGSRDEVEMHHEDYLDPDVVQWLCRACHGALHSRFGGPAPEWMADIRAAVKRIDAQRLAARAERRPAESMLGTPTRGGADGDRHPVSERGGVYRAEREKTLPSRPPPMGG
jgi:hypothetical protein